jgi:hypothetical protein
VGAGVHHDDAVTGAEEKFRLADYADAIIGDAVKKEDPTSVGMLRTDDPTSKENAVRGADIEVFAVAAGKGERGVGFADEVGGKFAANRMKEAGGDEPACDACQ